MAEEEEPRAPRAIAGELNNPQAGPPGAEAKGLAAGRPGSTQPPAQGSFQPGVFDQSAFDQSVFDGPPQLPPAINNAIISTVGTVEPIQPILNPGPVPTAEVALTAARLSDRPEAATTTSGVAARPNITRALSERTAAICDAANVLARAVKTEIERLNASKPNAPDELAKHDALVSFLEMVASELDKLAEAIEHALAARASPEQERIFLGKAAEIVDQLKLGFDEFLEENRKHLAGFTVRIGLFASAFGFLQACGVSGDVSAIASAVLNASIPTPKKQ